MLHWEQTGSNARIRESCQRDLEFENYGQFELWLGPVSDQALPDAQGQLLLTISFEKQKRRYWRLKRPHASKSNRNHLWILIDSQANLRLATTRLSIEGLPGHKICNWEAKSWERWKNDRRYWINYRQGRLLDLNYTFRCWDWLPQLLWRELGVYDYEHTGFLSKTASSIKKRLLYCKHDQ